MKGKLLISLGTGCVSKGVGVYVFVCVGVCVVVCVCLCVWLCVMRREDKDGVGQGRVDIYE